MGSDSSRREHPVVVRYLINPDEQYPSDWITVELTCFAGRGPHRPVQDTWAVRRRSWCLDADGDWIHEPLPSSRDDEFYARTRWPLAEALVRANEASHVAA